jgi:phosphoglycolate phosphatase
MPSLTIGSFQIDTVIFDFDGTLAKLNIDFDQMRAVIRSLMASHGIDENLLQTHYVLELIDDAAKLLHQRSPRQAEIFSQEAFSLIENIETAAAQNGALFFYTRDLLTGLQSRGLKCGIITRNCAKAIKVLFPDILNYCPVFVCRDDVSNVKPHPDHINLALSKLGSRPGNTLMIGDHPLDIVAGHNAGTAACGVLTGRCTREDFVNAKADIILADASRILDMV